MKKVVVLLSLVILLLGAGLAQADESRLSTSINGYDWNATPHNEKLAFVEGINYAIAIEYEIDKVMQQEGKPQTTVLSPFEQAWVNKFSNYSTSQIVREIDDFYVNNPDKLEMGFGRVVWYEFIRPGK